MKSKQNNIILGLIFLATAAVVILNIIGIVEFGFWTIILTVLFGGGVIYHTAYREWFGMFFCLGALTWVYRDLIYEHTGIVVRFWPLVGVALLLAVGFRFLFGKGKGKQGIFSNWDVNVDFSDDDDVIIGNVGSSSDENAPGERVYFKESFSGSTKFVTSDNLSYVGIINKFSGIEVHLEQATLAPDGATVAIENKFGGVEIYVPHGWNIVTKANSFCGGLETPNQPWKEGAPTLTIVGRNQFGGVEVNIV
ncbi:MAG: cell wall-active antibiotics response protein [Oscillospiraceae bacterium]|nr:cell wall-active antibiotics response protein [Oscillospiraceae bacterium]